MACPAEKTVRSAARARVRAVLMVLASISTVLGAQAPQEPAPPPLTITTTGVVIDVIATDKEGRPVLDLTRDDFEVKEDKALQQLQLCTLVSAVAPATPAQPAVTPTSTASVTATGALSRIPPPDAPIVTALLFDQLTHDVRPMAVRAALEFVMTMTKPRDHAGVFMTGLAFQNLQPFTNDEPRLVAALERVLSMPISSMRPEDQQRSQRAAQLDPTTRPTAGAESAGGTVTPLERQKKLDALPPDERQLVEMEMRMEESYGRLLNEMQGEATVAGLRAAVAGLSAAPGRKSLIFFSQDVVVTARTKSLVERLVQEANRANVTIYTIDATGLRVHSQQQQLAGKAAVAGAQGVGDVARNDGTAWTRELEAQEQELSSGTGAMARISQQTGGFLLENTNNLASGMKRIQQERANYYLLLYEPTNARRDGAYRKVSVKVKRKGVKISARPGYLAPS